MRSSLLLVAIAATSVHVLLLVGLRPLFRPAIPRWQASLYWVDYESGFVRRGLPGELLRMVAGRTPTWSHVLVQGFSITVAAIAALLVLAVALGRRARTPIGHLLVVTVFLASPFTLTLVAWDPGATTTSVSSPSLYSS